MIGHCRTGEHSSPVRHPHPRPTSPASSNRHTTLEKPSRTPAPGSAAAVPTGVGTAAGFKKRPVHEACIYAGPDGAVAKAFQWNSRGGHSPEPFQPAGASWKIAGHGVPTPLPAEEWPGRIVLVGLDGHEGGIGEVEDADRHERRGLGKGHRCGCRESVINGSRPPCAEHRMRGVARRGCLTVWIRES